MNNPFDESSLHGHDPALDNSMSQLGADAHQYSDIQPNEIGFSGNEPYQHHALNADALNSGWDMAHSQQDNSFHNGSLQDLNHSSWGEQTHHLEYHNAEHQTGFPDTSSDFGGSGYSHQADVYQQLGHESYQSYNVDGMQHHEHDHLGFANDSSVLNSAASCSSSAYTTVDNNGSVYKHIPGDSRSYNIGYVRNRSVYNSSNHYLGYVTTDGKIYDSHKNFVGWVDPGGHVYNRSGVEIYKTNRGVVGGAVYELLVYMGGIL